MNLIENLRRTLSARPGQSSQSGCAMKVKCNRCGEVLSVRINIMNDLSVEYDERGEVSGYICRKVALGKELCFQQIEILSRFDHRRRPVEHNIRGGTLVEE